MSRNILYLYFIVLFADVSTKPGPSDHKNFEPLISHLPINSNGDETGTIGSYYPKMQVEKFFESSILKTYEDIGKKYPVLGFRKGDVIDYEYDYDVIPEDNNKMLSTKIFL